MKIIFGCSGRGAKGVAGAHEVALMRKTKASNIFMTFIDGFLYVFSSFLAHVGSKSRSFIDTLLRRVGWNNIWPQGVAGLDPCSKGI